MQKGCRQTGGSKHKSDGSDARLASVLQSMGACSRSIAPLPWMQPYTGNQTQCLAYRHKARVSAVRSNAGAPLQRHLLAQGATQAWGGLNS